MYSNNIHDSKILNLQLDNSNYVLLAAISFY